MYEEKLLLKHLFSHIVYTSLYINSIINTIKREQQKQDVQ